MSTLLTLQRQFLARLIEPKEPADTELGMRAYREAYLLRIDEALRTDFDAVHQILGDSEMLALTSDYIATHPPHNPSIRWVGRSLASFIANSPHWSRVPVLAEVARFEWAKSCLFDSKDSPFVSLDNLQAIAPEQWGDMRLELIPALAIDSYPSNVPPICQQLTERKNVPSPTAEAEVPWLLWRKELVVHWRSLGQPEFAALQAVQTGATFAEICQQLIAFAEEEQVPRLAMQLLLQWCNDQIISKIHP